ncbi:hypothetical protein GTY88_13940 [Streptomyces sp. SID5926]|nr:hypothetical protein [Streptomyces sp. SID5926]
MTLSVDFSEMPVLVASAESPNGQRVPAAVEGVITTVAYTEAAGRSGGGAATSTKFTHPEEVVVANDGCLFVADRSRVRKLTPDREITTVVDGLEEASSLAFDTAGNLYIAEAGGDRVQKLTPAGEITTAVSDVRKPRGLAFDTAGNLYIAEAGRHRVRKVTPDGKISTVAGTTDWGGFKGDDEHAAAAGLNSPCGLCVDEDGSLYIADSANHRVRKVAPDGVITTFAGGKYPQDEFGDGGLATDARLWYPTGLARDIDGSLYISQGGHRVRKVTPDGIITTVAGSGYLTGSGAFEGDDGPATQARLNGPQGLTLDQYGNLYIADYYNDRVRQVAGAQERSLVIHQVKVPQASLGETAELTLEITAYRAGLAVDAGNIVQRFTAPTGFAFTEWPTYSYNGNGTLRGSLGSWFESDGSVMVVTSNLHLNTCARDKGPLVYTIPVKAVAAVSPGTYRDGWVSVGRHPSVQLSAVASEGPELSVTPGGPPDVELTRNGGPKYPGVKVRRDKPVPRQTVVVTLPRGRGLAFVPESGAKCQVTVMLSLTETRPYDGELSDDGHTLTVRDVDLGLSPQHPESTLFAAVTATATAATGSTHLAFKVGGVEAASNAIQVEEA